MWAYLKRILFGCDHKFEIIKSHNFTLITLLFALLHGYAAVYTESAGIGIIAMLLAGVGAMIGDYVNSQNRAGKGLVWHVTKKKN